MPLIDEMITKGMTVTLAYHLAPAAIYKFDSDRPLHAFGTMPTIPR